MHPPVHVGDVSHLHSPCPYCAVSYLRGYYHNLVSVIFGFIDRAICSRLVGIISLVAPWRENALCTFAIDHYSAGRTLWSSPTRLRAHW